MQQLKRLQYRLWADLKVGSHHNNKLINKCSRNHPNMVIQNPHPRKAIRSKGKRHQLIRIRLQVILVKTYTIVL